MTGISYSMVNMQKCSWRIEFWNFAMLQAIDLLTMKQLFQSRSRTVMLLSVSSVLILINADSWILGDISFNRAAMWCWLS